MKNPRMLYKEGGPHKIHGGLFSYIIVDEDVEGALDEAVEDGWALTTTEALSTEPEPAVKTGLEGKTKAELTDIIEAMLADNEGLEIEFNTKTTVAELTAKILEAKEAI